MSLFMRPMPHRVLPWAPNLPEEFRKRRGYALKPVIPMLIADAGGAEKKARYDFWLTVGELVSENYFGQIQEWCHEHGVASGGHLLMEESLLSHVPLYGDFFRCLRRLDAPSMDCLTSVPGDVPWFVARMIRSVADLEGNAVTMCETSDFVQRYRPEGDERPVRDVTEDEIRGTCNRLMLGGITTITSYYSFSGLSTSQLQRLNSWVGRCSTMLAGGHQVADIAVLYPVESIWPRFRPARHGATESPTAPAVEEAFDAATQALYSARRDFTYVDSRTLAEAKVEDGALVRGRMRWRVVVLPCADTLPMAAWENVRRFWRDGGVVIALAATPENSESEFPSQEVKALAREMFAESRQAHMLANDAGGASVFLPRGWTAILPIVLDALLQPDFACSDPASPLRVTHRRVDGREVYFVINDSPRRWEETVSLAVRGEGELWEPGTGEVRRLPSGRDVKLDLDAYGGVLLRFAEPRRPRRLPARTGRLPGMTFRPVPNVKPVLSKGEFVEGTLAPDEAHGADDAPAWRAVGTLTKGDADTFLFVSLNYAKPIDLSEAHSLVFDTWIPEGQQTPAQLLVIVRDADGGDYIARTGRPLSASGPAESVVPLSSLSLAGWSTDSNGRLDLNRVTSISIGWGGYYGKKGERIEFSLALPQIGSVRK
ncbi:MAG: glycosyl hydrolase, partial [Armatimonadota bacterium]